MQPYVLMPTLTLAPLDFVGVSSFSLLCNIEVHTTESLPLYGKCYSLPR